MISNDMENDMENFWFLVLNIYFEARGEPYLGKMAVGYVTINRCVERRKTVKGVVLEPWQFSWTNRFVAGKEEQLPEITEWDAFTECFEVAVAIFWYYSKHQNMHGINHYHNRSVNPAWAKKMKRVGEIGNHIFYVGK